MLCINIILILNHSQVLALNRRYAQDVHVVKRFQILSFSSVFTWRAPDGATKGKSLRFSWTWRLKVIYFRKMIECVPLAALLIRIWWKMFKDCTERVEKFIIPYVCFIIIRRYSGHNSFPLICVCLCF